MRETTEYFFDSLRMKWETKEKGGREREREGERERERERERELLHRSSKWAQSHEMISTADLH